MPESRAGRSRGAMKSELKQLLRSGVLERFDSTQDEAWMDDNPLACAQDLLKELQSGDGALPADRHIVQQFLQLRRSIHHQRAEMRRQCLQRGSHRRLRVGTQGSLTSERGLREGDSAVTHGEIADFNTSAKRKQRGSGSRGKEKGDSSRAVGGGRWLDLGRVFRAVLGRRAAGPPDLNHALWDRWIDH